MPAWKAGAVALNARALYMGARAAGKALGIRKANIHRGLYKNVKPYRAYHKSGAHKYAKAATAMYSTYNYYKRDQRNQGRTRPRRRRRYRRR